MNQLFPKGQVEHGDAHRMHDAMGIGWQEADIGVRPLVSS